MRQLVRIFVRGLAAIGWITSISPDLTREKYSGYIAVELQILRGDLELQGKRENTSIVCPVPVLRDSNATDNIARRKGQRWGKRGPNEVL